MEDKEKSMKEALDKKKSEIELKAKIKAAEDKKREAALKKIAPKKIEEIKMDYDSWHALRSRAIPKHHLKEVIWADFKGRSMSKKETCKAYDEALEKYGIKLSK